MATGLDWKVARDGRWRYLDAEAHGCVFSIGTGHGGSFIATVTNRRSGKCTYAESFWDVERARSAREWCEAVAKKIRRRLAARRKRADGGE